MNSQRRIMMLIDADNVSADVMEQAVEKVLTERGALHVRRAYCTPEAALANQKLFKLLSIRPIVNLSTGKNSTDILLATDAVDLVIAERPDVVVIVSSDSDFAPLVIRLREKGCRVEGIGQLGKTGEDSKGVYDAFIEIEHRKGRASTTVPPARKRAPARTSTKRAVAVEPIAAAEPPLAATPAPAAPASKPARQRRAKAAATPVEAPAPAAPAPSAPARAPMPDDLRSILAVLPELVRGQTLDLGIATERLRSEELLGARAPAMRLFRKFPDSFVLTPEQQPNKVAYVGLPKA